MNIKTLLLALISVLMLSGCALIKNSNEEKINTITPVGSAKFEAYGAERMDALGMVATKVDSRCSAVEFFKYVTKVYPAADDIIDVSMEETTIQKGAATSYSCKYSGLAVSYTPLSIDEAKKWTPKTKKQDAKQEQEQEVVVVGRPAGPHPACIPCACVTCGCQPCNAINQNNYYNPNNN